MAALTTCWTRVSNDGGAVGFPYLRVTRMQTDLPYRGQNIGVDMMIEAARAVREDFNLEQLRMEVRGG